MIFENLTKEDIQKIHTLYYRCLIGEKNNYKRNRNYIYNNLNKLIPIRKIRSEISKINSIDYIFSPCSSFLNKNISRRDGKDNNYTYFWNIVQTIIPNKKNRRYCGLSANQIDYVAYHTKNIIICENNKKYFLDLEKLLMWVCKKHKINYKDVCIVNNNIFNFLEKTNQTFNILDLDLMCHINNYNKIPEYHSFTNLLYKCLEEISVLNLITTIGNGLTNQDYEICKDNLYRALAIKFEIQSSSFKYCDNRVPMRCERLLLTKKEK